MSDAVTATIDSAPDEQPNWLTVILAKFRDLLRPKVDAADFDTAWLSARGHGGGKASAAAKAKARLAACDLTPWRFQEDAHPGLFVGLFLDAASAATLALDGDQAQPAESLHITLCYREDLTLDELTLARVIARIDDACAWRSPLTGSVSGYGRFLDSNTFYATPDVPGLTDLAMSVKSAVMAATLGYEQPDMREDHDFCPHISLAFLNPGDPNPVEMLPDSALRFDAVTVVYAGRSVAIPLRGQAEGAYGYSEVVVGTGEHGPRLFMEQEFAEPPTRVAILPTPGTYLHGSYGTVDITADRVERFVANHNAKVYGQDLPVQIDGSHDLKLSGAMGWLGSARVEADGSATAEVFWNPRGEQLIREDRVKYLSPEWWDEWTDGATGTAYQDVLIGLALTNRPFFKSASLTPLAAEEDDADPFAGAESDLPDSCFAYVPDDAKGKDGAKSKRKLRLCNMSGDLDAGIVGAAMAAFSPGGFRGKKVQIPTGDVASAKAKVRAAWKKVHPDADPDEMPEHMRAEESRMSDAQPVAMTEEQIKAFREQIAAEVSQSFEAKIAAESTARQAAEQRVASLEDAALTKQFTDEISGRAPDNDKGAYVFSGEFGADYLAIMRALPDDLREKYRTIERRKAGSFAELMTVAGTPIGSDARGDAQGGAWGKIEAKAKQYAEANKVTFAEAVDAVSRAEPALYEEHVAEQRRK